MMTYRCGPIHTGHSSCLLVVLFYRESVMSCCIVMMKKSDSISDRMTFCKHRGTLYCREEIDYKAELAQAMEEKHAGID